MTKGEELKNVEEVWQSIERMPRFLQKRAIDCLAEVERLAALESTPLDRQAIETQLEIYMRQSKNQTAASLTVSLQLWVAFAALITAHRDLKEFNPGDHLTSEMLNDVLRQYTYSEKELSDIEKRRKANGGQVKPSDHQHPKFLADLLMKAQRPLLHLGNMQERAKAVASMKRRLAQLASGPSAARIASGGLSGVSDYHLARYELAFEIAQAMQNHPEEFLCRPIASAHGRVMRGNSSRSEGSSDGYYYSHDEIRATANRLKWRDHKPKSKKRAEIMDAIIEGQGLRNTESVKRSIRRILHTL